MTQKKNKTKQVVTWPTAALFSLYELHRLNPKFVEITLRVRLANQIAAGKVAEIGCIPGGTGRPRKVYSMPPVTALTLDKARAEQINLTDKVETLVQVMPVAHTSLPSSVSTSTFTPGIAATPNSSGMVKH